MNPQSEIQIAPASAVQTNTGSSFGAATQPHGMPVGHVANVKLPANALRLPPGSSGSLTISSAAYLEHDFEGSLRASGPIIVGDGAHVAGVIESDGDILVAGIVTRSDDHPVTVRTRGVLRIAASGSVSGEVVCRHMEVYEGAKFYGGVSPLP